MSETLLPLAPGDRPLTLEEVADHYRMLKRQLLVIIREKQVEVLRYGHTIRFDRHALLSLEDALRCHEKKKQPDTESYDAPTPGRSPSRGAGRMGSGSASARRAITSALQGRKRQRSTSNTCEPNGTGRVVGFDPSARR